MIRVRDVAGALAFCLALSAQRPEDLYRATTDRLLPTVQEQLRSQDALQVAWAAYCARKLGLVAASADLQRALGSWTDREGAEPRHVRRVLLDALLQLDVRVPNASLLPHIEEIPAFLLLCRDVSHHAALLPCLDGPLQNSSMRWLAAGNLMSARKSAGAAAPILHQAVFCTYVDVVDPEQQSPDKRTAAARAKAPSLVTDSDSKGAEAHAVNPAPKGFPPAVRYDLTSEGRPGMTLVAPGHYSVFARFDETSGFSHESGLRPEDRESVLWAWLRVFLDEPALAGGSVQAIEFRTEQQLKVDVAATREKSEREMSSLVGRFVSAGLLTEDEAKKARPSTIVLIQDLRKNSAVPLPRIEGALGY